MKNISDLHKELLAQVMEYFTAFCVFIFLGVTMYMDIIGLILGKDFRGAIGTVPFMLISYMILGMLFNVSMWYKLSGETKYAINITLTGLAVTVAVNIAFMPLFSYWASVAAHVLSGIAMLLLSVWLGNRHYYIPYNWKKICGYILCGLVLFGVSLLLQNILGLEDSMWTKLGVNTVLLCGYMAYVAKQTGILKRI